MLPTSRPVPAAPASPRIAEPARRTRRALAGSLLVAACGTSARLPDSNESRRPPAPGDASTESATIAAIDSAALLADLEYLADDARAGRRIGTPGSADARRYLARRLTELGAAPLPGAIAGEPFVHAFRAARRGAPGDSVQGMNVIARIRGARDTTRVLVVSAHYDHVGVGRAVDGDSIYNGADDNASGAAALLAVASELRTRPPEHDVVLLFPDGEEAGLLGARAFVAAPPVPRTSIALNVNLDMLSRDTRGELWVAGPGRWPALRPVMQRLAADSPVRLRIGHDSGTPQEDWTTQSDHGAFHAAGIPFLYFGVEDHPDYHRPSDSSARVTRAFYVRAARTVVEAVRRADHCLPVLSGAGAPECR
jgi:hypothetical protein